MFTRYEVRARMTDHECVVIKYGNGIWPDMESLRNMIIVKKLRCFLGHFMVVIIGERSYPFEKP